MSKYPKIKPYNYELQKLNMASRFPQFKAIKQSYGFDFIGVLKPRTSEFTVKIVYGKYKHPRVYVEKPELLSWKHRYEDGSLCIYKHSELNWRKELLVSKYIIPLTCMWLYFYEIYILTGDWLGPEAPHNDVSERITQDDNFIA